MLRCLAWAGVGTGFIFLMTALGAALVFFFAGEIRPRVKSGMMGFAAGVMMAASVWSMLLPSIERAESAGLALSWLPAAVGIITGAGFLMLLDEIIARSRGFSSRGAPPLLITAVTVHNIPEGMAVALACALGANGDGAAGAAALALGIGIQNFPEGAAVSLPLRQLGMGRRRAFGYGVLSGAVEPAFGLLAVLAAASAQSAMPWLLGFAAGAMLYVCAHELIPEATGRVGAVGFTGGFLIMMMLDVALG